MTTLHNVAHRGQVVVLGGTEYVMPSLTRRLAEVYWPQMAAMQEGAVSPLQALQLACEVAHACLVRNYPQLSREAVDDMVDLDNWEQLLAAAGGGRSFKAWLDTGSAETPAGNPTPQPMPPAPADGTGAPSTPASPPPPAGDSTASTS